METKLTDFCQFSEASQTNEVNINRGRFWHFAVTPLILTLLALCTSCSRQYIFLLLKELRPLKSIQKLNRLNNMAYFGALSIRLLCRLLQEVHRACYITLSGATVLSEKLADMRCIFQAHTCSNCEDMASVM